MNSFFVAAEFALVAVDRQQLEEGAASGDRRAARALSLVRRVSFHLSGAQLGITISSLLLGWVIEPTVGRALQPVLGALPGVSDDPVAASVAVGLVIATGFQMVLGELVPKNLAIARPLGVSLALSFPVALYGLVFSPVIRFLNGSANWTVRRLGIEPKEELLAVRSLEELELVINTSKQEGTLAADAADMLTRAIRFGNKRAVDILVPRRDMVVVHDDRSVADLCRLSVETGYSRFPVVKEDIHDVLGLAHAKDIFEVSVEQRATTPVTAIMRPVLMIPESRDLEGLLSQMRGSGTQLALVVDEHGSTAGMIALEDLLEEIVGAIDDEYDEPEVPPEAASTGVWLVDGNIHRDELEELTGFVLPEGQFRTLAGFILSVLEKIPDVGERARSDGWTFEVVSVESRRIALVRVEAPTAGVSTK